jgi:hypothetical protein
MSGTKSGPPPSNINVVNTVFYFDFLSKAFSYCLLAWNKSNISWIYVRGRVWCVVCSVSVYTGLILSAPIFTPEFIAFLSLWVYFSQAAGNRTKVSLPMCFPKNLKENSAFNPLLCAVQPLWSGFFVLLKTDLRRGSFFSSFKMRALFFLLCIYFGPTFPPLSPSPLPLSQILSLVS